MLYVSGMHALNMVDRSLGTPGDWHASSLDWEDIPLRESAGSAFGEWGIAPGQLPSGGQAMVANHLRACVDLVEDGLYSAAGGMRDNYLSDESLTAAVFEMVSKLKESARWDETDRFMGREYGCDWLDFKEGEGL